MKFYELIVCRLSKSGKSLHLLLENNYRKGPRFIKLCLPLKSFHLERFVFYYDHGKKSLISDDFNLVHKNFRCFVSESRFCKLFNVLSLLPVEFVDKSLKY